MNDAAARAQAMLDGFAAESDPCSTWTTRDVFRTFSPMLHQLIALSAELDRAAILLAAHREEFAGECRRQGVDVETCLPEFEAAALAEHGAVLADGRPS